MKGRRLYTCITVPSSSAEFHSISSGTESAHSLLLAAVPHVPKGGRAKRNNEVKI